MILNHDVLGFHSQYVAIGKEINSAISKVLQSGCYVHGPRVEEFEKRFASYENSRFGIGVGSGTDALYIALRALKIGPGDEVITSVHTAPPTVISIQLAQATPRLADIDPDTFTINPELIEDVITPRTKAIIPVHLYGHPADIDPIKEIATKHDLHIIEDCAQSHGALYKKKKTGSLGHVGCFSFYPTKPLGAYGDAGMVVTNNEEIAEECRRIRNYGQSSRYVYKQFGINSRMDELQAAVLLAKLKYLDKWNDSRRKVAKNYSDLIKSNYVKTPKTADWADHVFHQYVIRSKNRMEIQKKLNDEGINTLIHYPRPIHLYTYFKNLGYSRGNFNNAEKISQDILSLPIHPFLHEDIIRTISQCVNNFN